MSEFANLQLRKEKRPYQAWGGGAHISEREFLDFVINGVSLWQLCKNAGVYGNISCIWLPDVHKPAVKRLLLMESADLPDDRVSLYVCAEDGDVGCGAVSIRITMDDEKVTWSDFAYQNNYDETMTDPLDSFATIDPISFDVNEYRNLLLPFVSEVDG